MSAEVAVFFENTSAGTALLKSMQDAATEKHPVALYGLTCIPQGGGKAQLKTSRSFFFEVAQGTYPKLQRLKSQAEELVGAASTSITPTWVPNLARLRE